MGHIKEKRLITKCNYCNCLTAYYYLKEEKIYAGPPNQSHVVKKRNLKQQMDPLWTLMTVSMSIILAKYQIIWPFY